MEKILTACVLCLLYQPLVAEEEEPVCFVNKAGELKCFTIDIGDVVGNQEALGGTTGGGCGSNSECVGGNHRELPWVPDFLDGIELPEQQRELMLKRFNAVQGQ